MNTDGTKAVGGTPRARATRPGASLGHTQLPVVKRRSKIWTKLTKTQRLFIQNWDGDPKSTADKIFISHETAATYMRTPKMIKALLRYTKGKGLPPLVADQEERKMFLSGVMRSEYLDTKTKLKACEIMCRMSGDFIERRILEGGDKPVQFIINSGVPRGPNDAPIDVTPVPEQLGEAVNG